MFIYFYDHCIYYIYTLHVHACDPGRVKNTPLASAERHRVKNAPRWHGLCGGALKDLKMTLCLVSPQYIYMYIYIHVCVHTCYTYIYIYMCVYIHVIHIYIYIYIYTCNHDIYIYIQYIYILYRCLDLEPKGPFGSFDPYRGFTMQIKVMFKLRFQYLHDISPSKGPYLEAEASTQWGDMGGASPNQCG